MKFLVGELSAEVNLSIIRDGIQMSIDIKSRLEEGNCLIVLDTNVLLNTYRYSPQFTEFAMECLKAIAGWVVLPATVRLEYEKHRRREFSGMERRIKNAASNTEEQITKMKDKVLASCNNFERLHFPDIAELKATLEHKLDELTGVLEAFFEERSTLQLISHSWNGNDLLMEIVSGLDDRDQVMPSPSQEDIYKWCEEGEDRYKRKMPPGFEDAKNKDGVRKYSDFILWKEVLRCASANKKDIIFVTDDVKADWWETISGSRQFYPRLIEEFSKTGMQIFPFVSYDFYKEVSSAFAIERPDAVDIALKMTDEEYCYSISERVLDSVTWDLMYNGTDYVDGNAHIGSEGIDELNIAGSEFLGAERISREDGIITYLFRFRVTLEGTSYDYWGRDEDTKEIVTSPGIDHIFVGDIEIEVLRSADIFLDFENDDDFESAEIVGGDLQETEYIDRSLEEYEPEPGELGFCPDCGCPLEVENDCGGFCISCAPNH